MSQDLVKFNTGGVPANPEALAKGLQTVGQNLQGSAGGIPLLRLGKEGYFVYGPEDIEVEEMSEWAINPYSIQHGFQCWSEGQLLGEQMVPFTSSPPPINELPDYGQPWQQCVSMMVQCMTGEDAGTVCIYKGTSVGMRNAVKSLINAIVAQTQTDKQHIVPVVTFDVDSYKHKQYGKIWTPQIDIQKWVSIDSAAVADDDGDGDTESVSELNTAGADSAGSQPTRRRKRRTAVASNDSTDGDGKAPASTNRRRRRRAS